MLRQSAYCQRCLGLQVCGIGRPAENLDPHQLAGLCLPVLPWHVLAVRMAGRALHNLSGALCHHELHEPGHPQRVSCSLGMMRVWKCLVWRVDCWRMHLKRTFSLEIDHADTSNEQKLNSSELNKPLVPAEKNIGPRDYAIAVSYKADQGHIQDARYANLAIGAMQHDSVRSFPPYQDPTAKEDLPGNLLVEILWRLICPRRSTAKS